MDLKYKVFIFVVLLVLGGSVYVFRFQPTGLNVIEDFKSPEIDVTEVKVLDRSASLDFSTDEESTATFHIEGQIITFEQSKEFAVNLESLSPGKQYTYDITSCDLRGNCNHVQNAFTTLLRPKPASNLVTGNAIINLDGVKESVNSLVFLLLLGVASFVLLSSVTQRIDTTNLMPVSMRMNNMLGKAEKHIRENKHADAFTAYDKVREVYEHLKPKDKGLYQARVLRVYSELDSHNKAKEASHLVDKYLEGSISSHETLRLRELLES